MLQQSACVLAGREDPGLGPGGVLARTHLTAVAAPPFLVDQAGQQVPGRAGCLLQRGADRLGDQLQPGQVTHRGQDVGRVGALRGALAHEPGVLQAGQGQVQEPVRAVVFEKALPELGQHAVVEAGIVQLQAEGVLEVDAAPHGLRRVAVRQAQQELQHADGGQLGGRETGTAVARVPAGEVLVMPQAVQAIPHPHRRRPVRIARPRNPRSQSGDLMTGTGTDGQHAPRQGRPAPPTRGCPLTTPVSPLPPRSPTESS